jgi:hypothetical protein
MNWFFDLHCTQPVAHVIGALAFVCVLGMALGKTKTLRFLRVEPWSDWNLGAQGHTQYERF